MGALKELFVVVESNAKREHRPKRLGPGGQFFKFRVQAVKLCSGGGVHRSTINRSMKQHAELEVIGEEVTSDHTGLSHRKYSSSHFARDNSHTNSSNHALC